MSAARALAAPGSFRALLYALLPSTVQVARILKFTASSRPATCRAAPIARTPLARILVCADTRSLGKPGCSPVRAPRGRPRLAQCLGPQCLGPHVGVDERRLPADTAARRRLQRRGAARTPKGGPKALRAQGVGTASQPGRGGGRASGDAHPGRTRAPVHRALLRQLRRAAQTVLGARPSVRARVRGARGVGGRMGGVRGALRRPIRPRDLRR